MSFVLRSPIVISIKLATLSLFSALANPALSDPGWLNPRMKESDCDGEFWKTQPHCYDTLDKQKTERLKRHMSFNFDTVHSYNCPSEQLKQVFLDREANWERYASTACDFTEFCVGPCGSGQSTSDMNCRSKARADRVRFLEDEIKQGVEIYGCPIPRASEPRVMETENFTVTIKGSCDLGLFGCDQVSYTGINKRTGMAINLMGREFLKHDQAKYMDLPEGFLFENGNIHYTVLYSGVLRVTDISNGNVLLDESGKWH